MKRSLMILAGLCWLVACTNVKDEKVATSDTAISDKHVPASHEASHGTLTLNNGAKWKSDESTRDHLRKMEQQLGTFNSQTAKEVQAYQQLGQSVQQETDQLIKDCRMQGPDHDALHTWLQTILPNVATLKKSTSVEEGEQAKQKLENNMRVFHEYFE
jgi:hypothetical protein